MFKKFFAGMALVFISTGVTMADIRLDVNNQSAQDCSVAINARTDKTTWTTIGWYVFMSKEEAPIIIEGASNIQDVYIYHDCGLKINEDDEVKTVWVKKNLQFKDEIPREHADGYEAHEFVRLKNDNYTIE